MMPALAGFWLLGLLLQLPLLAFVALAGALPLPLERAVDAPMALFLVAQLAVAFGAVRRVTRQQARRMLPHQPSSRGSQLVPAAE